MKENIFRFMDMWKADYQFKTLFSAFLSAIIGFGFTLFNGALGIVYSSVWNGSICVYYILLAIIRGIIVKSQKNGERKGPEEYQKRRRIYVITHMLLIVVDVVLIGPIAYMINGERSYEYGLIPAIAMAAYTTYRITMGVLNMRRARKEDNILVKELRVINLQDSLVSLLTLQNALIIASGDGMKAMKPLTVWTSAGIWIVIVFFTVKSFLEIKNRMEN